MRLSLIFTLILYSSYAKIPKDFLRELEMMYGGKLPVEKLFSGKAPKFDAYREVKFELYTQRNPEVHQRVLIDDPTSLKASNFNPAHPTRFLIHGIYTNGSSESIQYPRAAYMKKGEFNVFGVNWSTGAEFPPIFTFEKRLKDVGKIVAKFIKFLIRDGGAFMTDMGVIGHSSGGVVVSFVGKSLNGTLPLQISLDPAKEFSYFLFGELFINKTDAKYVEIIHTSGSKRSPFIHKNLGHADFYPNGGEKQPHCENIEEINDKKRCNHMIAIDYFAESIVSEKGFWSKRCKNYEGVIDGKCDSDGVYKKMGGEPIDTTEGIFYLETEKNYPFAQGWIG